jgi:hypothetical protein
MNAFNSAILLLNEDGDWWLCRGISNQFTVWVDTNTNKAIDTPKNFQEPWQVPSLSLILDREDFKDVQDAVDRILPSRLYGEIFEVQRMLPLSVEDVTDSIGTKQRQALIYVKVKSLKPSTEHTAQSMEFKLFKAVEIKELLATKSDREFDKAAFEQMVSISTEKLPENNPMFTDKFITYHR